MEKPPMISGAFKIILLIVLNLSVVTAAVGWSEMVPTDKAVFFSAGYYYSLSKNDWKRHPYAPVDLFGPGYGARIAAGIQADWFRAGGVAQVRYVSNSEWEAYAWDNGSKNLKATSFFYGIGWSVAVNPWFSRRISPIIGVEIGFFIPSAEETSSGYSGHKAKYSFLAPDGFSDYVAPYLAGVFRFNNNFSLVPRVGYHSAQSSEKLSGGNSRVEWLYFGLSIESRIPITLF
ncbi:MAG: hypothetical protein GY771_15175 [bacterium]|nr:hypothetical protein [bacterium]